MMYASGMLTDSRVPSKKNEWRQRMRAYGIDADRIMAGVYQGSRPPVGDAVRGAGFSTLVLAAEEFQPPGRLFPGVQVVHAPIGDDPEGVPRDHWARVARAVDQCLGTLLRGRRVLITCNMGLNRSGLISALTIAAFTGMSGSAAARLVQRRRRSRGGLSALCNDAFVRSLDRVPERRVLIKL